MSRKNIFVDVTYYLTVNANGRSTVSLSRMNDRCRECKAIVPVDLYSSDDFDLLGFLLDQAPVPVIAL